LSSTPLLLVILNLYSTYDEKRQAAALGAIPIPRVKGKWPGNIDILLRRMDGMRNGYLGDVWKEFIEEHGNGGNTINLRLLWGNQIITSEPEHIKAILASDFGNFEKGPKGRHLLHSLFGNGIFAVDGDLWKFHRSLTRPFFNKDRIIDFEKFYRHADTAIAMTKQAGISGSPIDIQDMAGRFTLDSATEFLFGQCVDSLSAPLPLPANQIEFGISNINSNRNNRFAQALGEAQTEISNRGLLADSWPLFEIFKDRTKESVGFLHDYVNPFIDEALRRKEAAKRLEDEAEERNTLLDHMIDVTDDKAIIRDELINMLIAGRDTTTATITVALYFLAMHPEVFSRVRKEVLDLVGATEYPTYDHVREMKYLRAVVNETLRLFPPVPFNRRSSVNSTVFTSPNGRRLYVPPKTECIYTVYLTHRRQDLWGHDSLKFDPDRWLDDRLKRHVTSNPFVFVPFNAGPRICLGQQFAYNETSFFLIRMLQQFDKLELVPDAVPLDARPPPHWKVGRAGEEKFWPKVQLTLYSKGGMWMQFHPAPEGCDA
jgi:cytochrome P450